MNFINESNLSSLDITANRVNRIQSIHGSNLLLLPQVWKLSGQPPRTPPSPPASSTSRDDFLGQNGPIMRFFFGCRVNIFSACFSFFVVRVSSDGVMGGATFQQQQGKNTKMTKFNTSLSIWENIVDTSPLKELKQKRRLRRVLRLGDASIRQHPSRTMMENPSSLPRLPLSSWFDGASLKKAQK